MRHFAKIWLLVAVGLALSPACSKKAQMPSEFAAVPADADIVGSLNAQALLAYAKEAAPRLVPAELKDKVPSFQALLEQAAKTAGIDLGLLKNVIFVGYAGSEDKMAFIAGGVEAKNIKGQEAGEHGGVKLYSIPNAMHYAELKGVGLVAAPNPEMLKKILDVAAGKEKRLADGERAKLWSELAGQDNDLDQLRVFLLTGNLPNTPPEMKARGGSLSLHMEKGLSGTLLSDENTARDLKNKLDMGLLAVRMMLSMPQDKSDMPVQMDEETKKLIGEVLNKLQSKQDGGSLSVSYRGNLKPLIEKAVAMGIKSWQEESSAEEEPDSDADTDTDTKVQAKEEAKEKEN